MESQFAAEDVYPVVPPPPNDDLAAATVISGLPFTDIVDTSSATLEAGEPSYDCGSAHGASVWYRYTPLSSGFFLIDTVGSDYENVMQVFIDGALTPVGCDVQSSPAPDSSQLLLDGNGRTTYLIGVAGNWGFSGTLTINLRTVGDFVNCGLVDVSSAECLGLENLSTNTGGPSWTNSNGWLAVEEVCLWDGVYCAAGAVSVISLYDNNLVGTLEVDLTGLSSLGVLDLGVNALSGEMSIVVGNLSLSLEYS